MSAFCAMVSWAFIGTNWDASKDFVDGAMETKFKYGSAFVLCIFAWLPGALFCYTLRSAVGVAMCGCKRGEAAAVAP